MTDQIIEWLKIKSEADKFNQIKFGKMLFKIQNGIVLRRTYDDSKNKDELKEEVGQ